MRAAATAEAASWAAPAGASTALVAPPGLVGIYSSRVDLNSLEVTLRTTVVLAAAVAVFNTPVINK